MTLAQNQGKLCECGCGRLTTPAQNTDKARGYVKGELQRFVQGHHPIAEVSDRFWAKVDVRGPNDCWEWRASLKGRGYGQFNIAKRMKRAHRVAYELLVGPIPEGLVLDHLCQNTKCVNPAHLEPVTNRENIRRSYLTHTHCPHGHPLDGTYKRKSGRVVKYCLACNREKSRRRRA